MQEDKSDAVQVVDPRVQTGNREKRAKRAFNFVEEGTYVKQVKAGRREFDFVSFFFVGETTRWADGKVLSISVNFALDIVVQQCYFLFPDSSFFSADSDVIIPDVLRTTVENERG